MPDVPQLAPRDVRERLSDGRGQLLDVREPWEYEIAHLPGAELIPIAELPSRLQELDAAEPVVVYCHHGREPGSAPYVAATAADFVRSAERGA